MKQSSRNGIPRKSCGLSWPWIVFFAVLLPALSAQTGEDTKPDAETLVAQIEEADFDARREIEKQIERMGEAARKALAQSAKNGPIETRQMAARLLGKLNNATLAIVMRDHNGDLIKEAPLKVNLYPRHGGSVERFNDKPLMLKSDGQGVVLLKDLAPGPYDLKLRAPGFHPNRVKVIYDETLVSILLSSGANRFVLKIQPNLEFKVKVEDQLGEPVRGAKVELVPVYDPLDIPREGDKAELSIEEPVNGRGVAGLAKLVGANDDNEVAREGTGADGVAAVQHAKHGLYKVVIQHADYRTRNAGSVYLKQRASGPEPLVVKLNKKRHARMLFHSFS
jgi:hypothetical protein